MGWMDELFLRAESDPVCEPKEPAASLGERTAGPASCLGSDLAAESL